MCVIVGAVMFVGGLMLFTNGGGVAPHRRTAGDPTGAKRAASRVQWREVFRRIPQSLGVMMGRDAERSDKLMSVGSLCVLAALVAWFAAVLAFITAFI
ncbi:hypothetical protein A5707_02345 [Mycobacterium kyorinense]|uniref:Uncharacterized protein n=1 Tax=Mycobacterium kyorinense TaxID=487514 RepID=A0A1A2Z7B1_9MYCO|nr:hypothetical protein A5707_02345 [Mycobacterium kyorinense]